MNIELQSNIQDKEESFDLNQSSHKPFSEQDKHKVLFSEESSSLYSSNRPEASYEYDYEVNNVKFAEEDDEECLYIKKSSSLLGVKYEKIDPSTQLYDSINIPYSGDPKILNPMGTDKKAKANIFKRLVSKKKRRIQTEYYDLDMCYITERVIGMGFPAYGCERIYRNTLEDTRNFLDRYHRDYKIYNLCIEKDRIYPKTYFDTLVGLFPFNDHSPCPCKLILDFCVDLCLYLTSHPRGVAAIHCKAGKGRTGVMIVCYLIFSGLCKTSDEALVHYANQRTLNNKGVTIASQKRYIRYFETFLSSNYEKPFMKCIPKILKFDLNKGFKNMIMNYNIDMSYFTTINVFKLKSCVIGPFGKDMLLTHQFAAITRKKLGFLKSKIKKEERNDGFYYVIDINTDEKINYDLKLTIKGKNISFYSWFNLWYATFEIISKYVIDNNYFEDIPITRDSNINNALASTNLNDQMMRQSNLLRESHVMTISLNKMKSKHRYGSKRKSAIETLKNNKDLNNILDGIDDLAKGKGVPLLDRNKLVFVIEKKELDKLKPKDNIDDFKVVYTYQLLPQ